LIYLAVRAQISELNRKSDKQEIKTRFIVELRKIKHLILF